MKTSSAQDFSSIAPYSFRSLSTEDIDGLLLPYYLGLDFDARRARFGGAVSDSSIRQYCQGLDFDRAIVLACLDTANLVAVIELHSIAPDWRCAELVLASSATGDQTTILGHLLQLAAFAAGKRGCAALMLTNEAQNREALALLGGMASTRLQEDDVFVDLDDYARLHGFFLSERKP
jgi:hypothetical protein